MRGRQGKSNKRSYRGKVLVINPVPMGAHRVQGPGDTVYMCYDQRVKYANGMTGMPIDPLLIFFPGLAH